MHLAAHATVTAVLDGAVKYARQLIYTLKVAFVFFGSIQAHVS